MSTLSHALSHELAQSENGDHSKGLDRKIDLNDVGLAGEAKDELDIFDSQRKSSARIQTLQEELEQLIDDQEYTEFLTEIARDDLTGKYAKDDPNDKDFIPPVSVDNPTKEELGVDLDEGVEKDFDEESVSEGSQSSGAEDSDDGNNEVPEVTKEELELIQQEVPVALPKESLKSMQDRFPPFWRFKHGLRNVKLNPSELDEEDPDFQEPLDEEPKSDFDESTMEDSFQGSDVRSGMNVSSDSSDFDPDDTIDEEEIEEEKRILDEENAKDAQENIKGLIEMVEDMSFVCNDKETVEDETTNIICDKEMIDHEKESDKTSKENGTSTKLESMTCLEALETLNNSTYNSDEDPDYEPSEKLLESLNYASSNEGDGKWLRSSQSIERCQSSNKDDSKELEAME